MKKFVGMMVLAGLAFMFIYLSTLPIYVKGIVKNIDNDIITVQLENKHEDVMKFYGDGYFENEEVYVGIRDNNSNNPSDWKVVDVREAD